MLFLDLTLMLELDKVQQNQATLSHLNFNMGVTLI